MARKHDELFKQTLKDPRRAADALRNILPAEIAAAVDWSTLAVMPGSFVTEGLRHRHSDLLYRVKLHGQPALIYVLFEHQSSPDPLMPLRVVEYSVCAWQALLRKSPKLRKLPPILPVVLYHGRRPWTAPLTLSAMYDIDAATLDAIGPWLPQATFVLQNLGQTDDDWLRTRLSAMVALVFGSLKHSRSPEALEAWLRGSLDLLRQVFAENEIRAIKALFGYAFSADLTPERLNDVVAQIGQNAEEVAMTVLDQLMEKGREQGLEQGLEQGREEGREEGREQARAAALAQALAKARVMAQQLLALRFGKLDDDVRAQVTAFDIDRLDALNAELADPAFVPTTIDAVLAAPTE